jgi:hypothetical protein
MLGFLRCVSLCLAVRNDYKHIATRKQTCCLTRGQNIGLEYLDNSTLHLASDH